MMARTVESRVESLRQLANDHLKETAALAGGASFALLQVAMRTDRALTFIALCGLGALLGMVALWALTELIPTLGIDQSHRLIGSVVVAAVGFGLSALGIRLISIFMATGGLGLAIVAIAALSSTWDKVGSERSKTWTVLGVIVLGAGLLVANTTGPWQLAFGLLLWVIGLVTLKVGLSRLCVPPATTGEPQLGLAWWVLVVGAVATVAAVVMGLTSDGLRAAAPAVMLGYAGLSIVGLGATVVVASRESQPPVRVATGLVGLGCFAFGLWLLYGMFPDWSNLALVLGGLVGLIGAFFVLRGEGIVALVLVGALLGWVMVDRTEQWVEPDQPGGLIVAFGDSFAAGQGTLAFLPDVNSLEDSGNTCRRSVRSFPFLVGQALGYDVESYACSGADINQVATAKAKERLGQKRNPQARVAGHLQQLESATSPDFDYSLNGRTPDVILVAMGVNDAAFSKIVVGCALPTPCDADRDNFLAQTQDIEPALVEAYDTIGARFPGATLVAMHYPAFIGSPADGCRGSLTRQERAFANEFVITLNQTISTAAAGANAEVVVFDKMARAFAGRTLCDATPAANVAHVLPTNGPFPETLLPSNWVQGSGHPNELGHRCTAASLVKFLVDEGHVPAGDLGAQPDCELADETTSAIWQAEIDNSITDKPIGEPEADFDAKRWQKMALKDARSEALQAAGLLLVGGALLALALVRSFGGKVLGLLAPFKPVWLD